MTSPDQVERFCVHGLGVEIVIECDDAALASSVRKAWRDAACHAQLGASRAVTVSFCPGADVHSPDLAEILHNLSPAVTREIIGARAGELLMLHAAALADPVTGATVVLVAPSGTGKTTAAITLGQTFAYLTDETAGITKNGIVLAYRKPLSVVGEGAFKKQVAPSELRMITSESSGHLTAVLFLDRDPDHDGPPQVVPLETIDALALLAPQVSFLGEFERPLQRLVSVLQLVGGANRVTYSEAAQLESVVLEAMSGVAL